MKIHVKKLLMTRKFHNETILRLNGSGLQVIMVRILWILAIMIIDAGFC